MAVDLAWPRAVWPRQGGAQGYQEGTALPFMGKDVFHKQGEVCLLWSPSVWWSLILVPAALDHSYTYVCIIVIES